MDPLTDEDINFITDETFDLGVNFPTESQGVPFENDTNEEVLVGPVKHLERCVAKGIDVNSKNGNQQKPNETVLKWSPLSSEKLVEIVKEANRLANQFEKCALKEKENASKQAKEGRSGDRSNLGKGNPKAKLRILHEEREHKHSQRSPRRETFVVLDSPNKALLPSVDLSPLDPPSVSENSPLARFGKGHSDNSQSQSGQCKTERNRESGFSTPDNPAPGRETNLSKERKEVIKKSVLPTPSSLKLPSALNRKGTSHSSSPIKPYQYTPSKESRTLSFVSSDSVKQAKGASLNSSVKCPDHRGTSLISRNNYSKLSMVPKSKMSASLISSKNCTEASSKQLTGVSRSASVGTRSRPQPPSKLIPPGKPGTYSNIHTGIKIQRANSEVLKSKTPELHLKATAASTRQPKASTSATQSRLFPPKKGISSHIKR